MRKNTYFINPESSREKARLIKQDLALNDVMQGLFPKSIDPYAVHTVLDLACGSGGWALEVAATYPHMQVLGVDISQAMTQYANICAKARNLENCSFEWRTVFPSEQLPSVYTLEKSFDFINLRLGTSFMLYAGWLPLLQWGYNTLHSGGYFRVTEQGQYAHSHGQALGDWFLIMSKSLVRHKMLESDAGNVTLIIDKWMEQVGFRNIQEFCYLLNFSAGRKHHQAMVDDWTSATELSMPFLIEEKIGTREELEAFRQKIIQEMNAPEFLAHLYYPSFVGQKI